MKRKFEGSIFADVPADWRGNEWLGKEPLEKLKGVSDTPFRCVTHPEYHCTEYDIKMSLFTFGKLKFRIPMTVIGSPLSVDCMGYEGDFAALVRDYKRRKGLFLALNLSEEPNLPIARAQTLASCIFDNKFSSFDSYLTALRSGYRRRILAALEKGKTLTIRKIENKDFDDGLYDLYLQVLSRSKYPLETLNIEFFRRFEGDIFVFYEKETAVAFAALIQKGNRLNFIFGGMDYEKRDRFDSYYNLLLSILRYGIESGVQTINLGQTAEQTKLRLGCYLEHKYMAAFSGNRFIDWLLRRFGRMLGYKESQNNYRVFGASFEKI